MATQSFRSWLENSSILKLEKELEQLCAEMTELRRKGLASNERAEQYREKLKVLRLKASSYSRLVSTLCGLEISLIIVGYE